MDNKLILPCEAGLVSDGYHTFDELYDHRNLLWANLLVLHKSIAFITYKNDKGEIWPGWFIAGLNTSFGQITYHLPIEPYWDILSTSSIKQVESNDDYDGHTPGQTLTRLTHLLKSS